MAYLVMAYVVMVAVQPCELVWTPYQFLSRHRTATEQSPGRTVSADLVSRSIFKPFVRYGSTATAMAQTAMTMAQRPRLRPNESKVLTVAIL